MLKNRLQLQTAFIKKLEEKFGKNRFDYSLLQYKDYKTPVEIIEKETGKLLKITPHYLMEKGKKLKESNKNKF